MLSATLSIPGAMGGKVLPKCVPLREKNVSVYYCVTVVFYWRLPDLSLRTFSGLVELYYIFQLLPYLERGCSWLAVLLRLQGPIQGTV